MKFKHTDIRYQCNVLLAEYTSLWNAKPRKCFRTSRSTYSLVIIPQIYEEHIEAYFVPDTFEEISLGNYF